MRGGVGRAPHTLTLTRRKALLGVVVVVVCTLLLLHLADPDDPDDDTGLTLYPNAPVILVADDADDSTERRLVGHGHVGRNDSAVWAALQGLQQTGTSRARLFLVHALSHGGGGGLVSEAVFNVYPNEVFFLYRPLHEVPLTAEAHKTPEEWLQLLLNCSLGVAGRLLHGPHLWKSRSFRVTHAAHCHAQQVDMARCVAMACQERSLRAAFTTEELSMAGVTELLTVYQHLLKVVVVVRDPRALLATHLRTHHHHPSPRDLKVQADIMCVAMAARISSARALQQRFPGAVLVLHHEHLVVHPRRVLDAVNHFLGLRVSGRSLTARLALLSLDIPEQERLQLVNMWQLDFTLQEVRQVDKSCSRYYRGLEYLPVPDAITARTNFFVPWGDAQL